MKVIQGHIDYTKVLQEKECRFFTANNTLKKNGELVMGAGNALAAKQAIPNLALIMGKLVANNPNKRIHTYEYGEGVIASFQTKEHWRNPTPIHVLKGSIQLLKRLSEFNPDWQFHLPMPAVNHGGMTLSDVVPLLEELGDNVIIYY